METNKGKDNPYHNNYHMERVAMFAFEGAKILSVEKRDIVLLITAALFHDFNHLGGIEKTDDENIELAVSGMKEYFLNIDKWLFLTVKELEIVENLIRATRYPYIKDNELTLSEKILRDSDVIQGMYCENYANGIVRALATEMAINNPSITFAKALDMQMGFYNSLKFETNWAQNLFYKKIDETKKLVEDLKFLYKF